MDVARIKHLFQVAAEYCHPFTVYDYEAAVGELSMAFRGYKSIAGRVTRGTAWGLSLGIKPADIKALEDLLSRMPNTEEFYLSEEDQDDYQVGEDYGWDGDYMERRGELDEGTVAYLQDLRKEREELQGQAIKLASRAAQITSRYR